MKVAAAVQNAIQHYRVIYDEKKKKKATTQTSLNHFFKRVERIVSNKEPEPVPSTSGMSDTSTCPLSSIADDPSALPTPTSSISNSSCLFTWCHPLCASCYTMLLYFSRLYYKIKNVFFIFCVWFLCIIYVKNARRSNQSTLKKIIPEYSFEGLTDAEAETPILWPSGMKSQLTGKDLDARKDWRQKVKWAREDEMVGWHHQLNGPEFEQTPRDTRGQRSLACCSPWGCSQTWLSDWTICEKYYKPITVQYYIANCVSWAPRLTLLDLGTNWTCEHALGLETLWYLGDLLY